MTPSARIKLIKSISEILGKEDYRFIDLTLREFRLPTQDEWNGNPFEYVAEMVSNGNDEQLIELASHLDLESSTSSPIVAADFPYWKHKQYKLFLSHISSYKKETAELQKSLEYYGISSFVAHEDIAPTKEWQSEIENALATMDGLAALLTPSFHESKWTDQEIGVAMGRSVQIIPIRLGIDPYGFIGKFQGVQGLGKTSDQLAKEIVEILIKNKTSEPAVISALIYSLPESSSYAESKEKIELIEKASHISKELLNVLNDAVKNNGQVRDSWGVPEKIKELTKKYK